MTPSWCFSAYVVDWREDALLSDGRLIKVEREADWTSEFRLRDPFFGLLPFYPRVEQQGFTKYRLRFVHPDTHEKISWKGEPYFRPILLDLVDGTPYLVLYGSSTKDSESEYGCPELPYVYLKYNSVGWGKWEVVSIEHAPVQLKRANLSPKCRFSTGRDETWASRETERRGGRSVYDLSAEEVQKGMDDVESSSGGFFQRMIPRNYAEWRYKFKKNHRTERQINDCRPPLQPLPDIPLPKPIDIELETVESKDYIANSVEELRKFMLETQGSTTSDNCSKFFRPLDPETLILGEVFANDPSGNKRLPYSGPPPLPSGHMFEKRTQRYCDDNFIWFVAGHEEPGKTIITKYTTSGDFLYSIQKVDPKIADNKLAGYIIGTSITVENGYCYFWWNHNLPLPTVSPIVFPRRIIKFRFREPGHEAASK